MVQEMLNAENSFMKAVKNCDFHEALYWELVLEVIYKNNYWAENNCINQN